MDQATFRAYTTHASEFPRRHASSRRVVAGIAQYFARAFDPGDRILDVGAGAGGDLALLVAGGYQAYGMEPVAEMRAEAIRAHPGLSGRLVEGSLPDDLPDPASIGGPFDGAICAAVLQHLPPGGPLRRGVVAAPSAAARRRGGAMGDAALRTRR